MEDVAKRLIDYGFHAPTMSFPVPGTLMVEPTESEDLAELDRFCDAMIKIREEIGRVAAGEWPRDDNPLVNAPHTSGQVTVDGGNTPIPGAWRRFPRDCIPARCTPTVQTNTGHQSSRIDGGYGDRNLVCTCPSPAAFESCKRPLLLGHRDPDVDPAFLAEPVLILIMLGAGRNPGQQGLTLVESRRLSQHRSRDEAEQVGELIQIIGEFMRIRVRLSHWEMIPRCTLLGRWVEINNHRPYFRPSAAIEMIKSRTARPATDSRSGEHRLCASSITSRTGRRSSRRAHRSLSTPRATASCSSRSVKLPRSSTVAAGLGNDLSRRRTVTRPDLPVQHAEVLQALRQGGVARVIQRPKERRQFPRILEGAAMSRAQQRVVFRPIYQRVQPDERGPDLRRHIAEANPQ